MGKNILLKLFGQEYTIVEQTELDQVMFFFVNDRILISAKPLSAENAGFLYEIDDNFSDRKEKQISCIPDTKVMQSKVEIGPTSFHRFKRHFYINYFCLIKHVVSKLKSIFIIIEQ